MLVLSISLVILILIVLIALFAIKPIKLQREMYKKTGKHPKGHYMGMGIALGMPIGIAWGVAVGNISLGPAIGCAIGVAIGAGLEKKHAHELRELTKEEIKAKRQSLLLVGGLGLVVLITMVVLYIF